MSYKHQKSPIASGEEVESNEVGVKKCVNKEQRKDLSSKVQVTLRLLHTMNVRFSLLDIAQRILGVTLPNFQ